MQQNVACPASCPIPRFYIVATRCRLETLQNNRGEEVLEKWPTRPAFFSEV